MWQAYSRNDPMIAYPIDLACKHEWGLEVIEMMLNAGAALQLLPADGNEYERYRSFPILMAAKHGNAALMRLLLEKGGDEQASLVDHKGVCLSFPYATDTVLTGMTAQCTLLSLHAQEPTSRVLVTHDSSSRFRRKSFGVCSSSSRAITFA